MHSHSNRVLNKLRMFKLKYSSQHSLKRSIIFPIYAQNGTECALLSAKHIICVSFILEAWLHIYITEVIELMTFQEIPNMDKGIQTE